MRRKQILVWLALVAALGAGYTIGRATPRSDPSVENASAFVDAVGSAGTSTLTLQLLRAGDLRKLDRLHRTLLRSNLESAERLRTAALKPEIPMPNVVAAAVRTAEFCASDPEFAELADTAAQIHDRLRALSDGAL